MTTLHWYDVSERIKNGSSLKRWVIDWCGGPVKDPHLLQHVDISLFWHVAPTQHPSIKSIWLKKVQLDLDGSHFLNPMTWVFLGDHVHNALHADVISSTFSLTCTVLFVDHIRWRNGQSTDLLQLIYNYFIHS